MTVGEAMLRAFVVGAIGAAMCTIAMLANVLVGILVCCVYGVVGGVYLAKCERQCIQKCVRDN